jgi:hypothetical protein
MLCNRDGPATAGSCLSSRQAYPALCFAVFFDVEVFLPVEKHVYAAFKSLCIVELAGGIHAKSVGRCRFGHLGPVNEVDWMEALWE